ncbi:MAG TPA: hypothetical protein VNZ55_07240 [Thermomicrobiales bacterium]|nr:hypothetical protein [Thermomicrobiales bacterium]
MTDPTKPERAASPAKPILTTRRLLWLVGVAVFLALLVLFIADNFVLVEMRLFTLRIRARLAWLLIVPFLLGIALGFAAGEIRQRHRRTASR